MLLLHKKILSGIVFLLLAGGMFLPVFVKAQAVDPVRFTINPEIAGPNELVSIEVEGIGSFLGSATITWQKDGKTEKSGVGERIYSFTTGALGSRTTVRVIINSGSQGTISRDFIFVPSLVNLVWEADTYTPSLYLGKALYSAGSSLKVLAYPTIVLNGARVSTNSMSFQWRRNGEPVPQASGLGRNSFSFEGDQLKTQEQVGVDVYIGSSKVGHGEVVIPASAPFILLYERDPLRGVNYEQAFPQKFSLSGREITIQAEPFFFSNMNKTGDLSYVWMLNGQQTSGPDTEQGILTLRQTGNGAGNATLSVEVQNNDVNRLVQHASAAFQVTFGEQSSSGSLLPSLGAAVVNFTKISQTNLPYTPLEPLPGVPENAQSGQPGSLGPLLNALFRLLIVLGALFAVAMLTVSGIRYMLSEVGADKGKAKTRIQASIYGLLLLMISWLLLYTINPKLLEFNLIIPQDTANPTTATPTGQQTGTNRGTFTHSSTLYYTVPDGVKEALGCTGFHINTGTCVSGDQYLTYNPADTSNPATQSAIQNYNNDCNGSFFTRNHNVKVLSGDLVNAPGTTLLVCQW